MTSNWKMEILGSCNRTSVAAIALSAMLRAERRRLAGWPGGVPPPPRARRDSVTALAFIESRLRGRGTS
jgi:hypothetical protein